MTKAAHQRRGAAAVYDRLAGQYAADYDLESVGGHVLRERRERVCELLRGVSGRLLDVGAGPGATAAGVAALGLEYWGVDASPKMIALGRAKFAAAGATAIIMADARALPFVGSSFDAVLCVGVIDWLPDRDRALAELTRVLRPGGTMVVSFPNLWSPYAWWRAYVFLPAIGAAKRALGFLARRPLPPHLARRCPLVTPTAAAELLRRHDAAVIDIVHYNFNPLLSPFDELFPRAALALARRCSAAPKPLRRLGAGYLVRATKRR